MSHIFFSEHESHICQAFPLFTVSWMERIAVVLEAQKCMRFEPENLFVIFWSFLYDIIRSPRFFLITLDDIKTVFSDIFLNKGIFHKRYDIPLFAESRKNIY
jgi:hypothetical protein